MSGEERGARAEEKGERAVRRRFSLGDKDMGNWGRESEIPFAEEIGGLWREIRGAV